MKLNDLLNGIDFQSNKPIDAQLQIEAVAFDSRNVKPNSLFVAIQGVQVDGHKFIDMAIQNGARVVVCEKQPQTLMEQVTYIQVANSAEVLGALAANFYGHPSKKLNLVGVTGTNGKTSTVTLLYRLFQGLGYQTGLVSTVENRIGEQRLDATHTTPDALTLQQLLAQMLDEGCDYVFMEVSSHAVHQRRIAGAHFTGAGFTNISHDHLDYHKTFQNYIYAKKQFFDDLPASAFAIVNADDKRGAVMLQNTAAKKHTFALKTMADFKAKILENTLTGLVLEVDGETVYSRLVGDFNAYNILVVYGIARLLGQPKEEVLAVLSSLQTAAGRFEVIRSEDQKMGIVDYAHTPDALEKVLKTLQSVCSPKQQIITVVGCGGDRDKQKRPKMAKVACLYSDQVILTSDNPRTEKPEAIIEDMEKGIPAEETHKVLVNSNRRQAIQTACRLAKAGDAILIAGKGHETYQEINGIKHPFDDKEELKNALAKLVRK